MEVYIGTWSNKIYLLDFSPESGTLAVTKRLEAELPTYLAMSEDRKTLFATCEVNELNGVTGGGLYAFDLDGGYTELLPTGGGSPCHIARQGGNLLVSNYLDGSLAVFELDGNRLRPYHRLIRHTGRGTNPERQTGPHMHCAMPVPDSGGLFCAVDLGLDTLTFYSGDGEVQTVRFPPGSGPRHAVFSRNGDTAWVAAELSNEVYSLAESGGKWEITGRVSALPPGYGGASACGAIRISNDNKRLCVSNRGHDSIACFSPDLKLQWIQPSGGRTPWDFAFTPDDRWLIVANKDSDNVTVLPDGGRSAAYLTLRVEQPSCVLI